MSAENAPSTAPLLDVQSVNVYYGEFHALQDVSYRIHEGEIVALLGANGSGKSTTMKTILRLVKPRSGEIRFDGRSILGDTTADVVRAGIASVPEARRVFPEMTIEENLLVGAHTRRGGAAQPRAFLQPRHAANLSLPERVRGRVVVRLVLLGARLRERGGGAGREQGGVGLPSAAQAP